MNKILLLISLFTIFISNSYWVWLNEEDVKNEEVNIVVPDEITWTDRFILSEMKDLRVDLEWIKRELYKEIQDMQLDTVDKALSYSANTVNFFFIFITIIVMWFWVVWWRTIWDIKKATKESMDRETKKIIKNFEKQISELEKEQKVNIFWRQFNISESDVEKMEILDKIYRIKPESQYVTIERWNVYLSMWLYEKVLEVTDSIISWKRTKNQPHALFNRACAYLWLNDIDNVISTISYLVQLAPEYKDLIKESEYMESIIKNPKIKSILK